MDAGEEDRIILHRVAWPEIYDRAPVLSQHPLNRVRLERLPVAIDRQEATSFAELASVLLVVADLVVRVVFEPNGRMVVLMTSGGRAAARSSSEMTELFRSMFAYTGRWSIDGEKFVTQVDGGWDPSWVGTQQVRYYTFDGRTLSLRTSSIEHPTFTGRKVIGYVEWQREEGIP